MSWGHAVRERIGWLLRSRGRAAWVAGEIRFHLELETARQMGRGHDARTARAHALQRFGDPVRVLDATRDERTTFSLETSMHDLRFAIRSLRKHSGFTVLALITLALGI